MYALNRTQIIGHLTEDPQIRQTPNGQTVGDLNIVTRSYFTNSGGQQQASTAYHSIVVWRGLADVSGRFLKKGSQVFIAGRIQTDEWEDQTTGQKRYKTRIVADDLILLDPRNPNPAIPAESKLGGGLNKAEVIGNITRDPELRQTPNGDSVVSFGVATNFVWKDRMGNDQEKAEFHNIVAWGDLAQHAADHLKKGRKVYVTGRLQTRSWETPEGTKRHTTEIIADRILALGVADEELGAPIKSEQTTAAAPAAPAAAPQENKESVVPKNPTEVPDVNYKSDVKPEDLPF